MISIQRYPHNPILTPNENLPWQAIAVYNGCPVKVGKKYHLLFRALSSPRRYYEHDLELSQIGYASSRDGLHFSKPRLWLTPEFNWEQFGCEDPKVTFFEDRFYVFYTALSDYPHTAEGIKIGVAVTKDFKNLLAKHQVTHFNSKSMALFPERINGQMTALLTLSTDHPPAKIAFASFKQEEEIWSQDYWRGWLDNYEKNLLLLKRTNQDQIEIGAPPLKTDYGWLLIYAHIRHYPGPNPLFGIEAALLDLKNPHQIVGQTQEPLLVPEQEYELYGKVPKVIFPSGALVEGPILRIYYSAADTTCCLAETELKKLLNHLKPKTKKSFQIKKIKEVKLNKYTGNPIITPIKNHSWESKYTFNPAAIWAQGKVHLLYRAQGDDDTSVFGYAASPDGFTIKERLPEPIYTPRENFETKLKTGYSGCEDPRISQLGDHYYVCYTAFDGINPTKIALSKIKVKDFLEKEWRWSPPQIISCPRRSDKNAGLFPQKIKKQYAFFHRIGGCIWLDYVQDLKFGEDDWVGGKMILCPQPKTWESRKVGIAGPPLATKAGWLVIYHALCEEKNVYRLGAMLLDRHHPENILYKLPYPILEPSEEYESQGLRPGTVYSCGGVIIKNRLFVYYGAADQVIGVATIKMADLFTALKQNPFPRGINH